MPRMATMPLPSPCRPWHGVQKILKRFSPRSSSSRFTGIGNLFDSLETTISSSVTEPRATVFSSSGRSERPSVKKSEGDNGRFLGCRAISCLRLHPARTRPAANTPAARIRRTGERSEALIIFHLENVRSLELLQKTSRIREMKPRVAGLDAQIEAVAGGVPRETIDVEQRMMRTRQAIEREHAENRGQRGSQHGHLKRDGDKRRPAIERPPADILRIGNHRYPVLQTKTAKTAAQSANQGDQGHGVALQANSLRETLDGERRIRLEAAIARQARPLGRGDQLLRGFKLRHHAINV